MDIVKEYIQDVLYCFKISLKIAIIPVILGAVISLGYLLISGESVELIRVLYGVRNAGIMFACAGLFICAAAFLRPTSLLRPLSYDKTWRKYFNKFGLVGSMFCICSFVTMYFLVLDVVIYKL